MSPVEIVIGCLLLVLIGLVILFRPRPNNNIYALNTKLDDLFKRLDLITANLREDFKANREEAAAASAQNRTELNETLNGFRREMTDTLSQITAQNKNGIEAINKTLEEKIGSLIAKSEYNSKDLRETIETRLDGFSLVQRNKFDEWKLVQKEGAKQTADHLEKLTEKIESKLTTVNDQAKADALAARQTLMDSFRSFNETYAQSNRDVAALHREKFGALEDKQSELVRKTEEKLTSLTEAAKKDAAQMRETLVNTFKDFQLSFDRNVASFNNLQREKFEGLERKQSDLVQSTEKKLDTIREAVEEKLQKTLQERLGQSFEVVSQQLASVQKGLGEMQTLAQDVGGLKKVLSNVKMRGGFGEVQLHMLLENILAPEQYEVNVATKKGSTERVEFAVKFPNKEGDRDYVWLPIDAKFPKDAYENLQLAYDSADAAAIEQAQKALEGVIRKMAKDICEKYIDAPNTTNFGIMFLPFEGLFAEVVRKASLLEDIQRSCNVIITGPTTLAVILNSLQMGFRTLAIQKRSSEVWQVLSAVKKEFNAFGGLLEKAQNNIQIGLNQLDDVVGVRTRQIQRKLRGVEVLEDKTALNGLPGAEVVDEEE